MDGISNSGDEEEPADHPVPKKRKSHGKPLPPVDEERLEEDVENEEEDRESIDGNLGDDNFVQQEDVDEEGLTAKEAEIAKSFSSGGVWGQTPESPWSQNQGEDDDEGDWYFIIQLEITYILFYFNNRETKHRDVWTRRSQCAFICLLSIFL
jgi:hypothetical protein